MCNVYWYWLEAFHFFSELDLVGLAMGYALLHLPKMPELRGVDASKFDFSYPDLSEIKYKDKAREKQRIQKLERGWRW